MQHEPNRATARRSEVAIIGMGCMFPGAPNLDSFWQNIVSKVDAITDPPPEAWDSDLFYDRDSQENDRVYCRRGGYLAPHTYFNPLEHGIMPRALEGGEPDQWLGLHVATEALADAGYSHNLPQRERTAVILGKGTYINRGNLTMVQHSLMVDQMLGALHKINPQLSQAELGLLRRDLKRKLPAFNAETAPAMVPNIVAGRIANRLDLMGPSYTVDAACASSLVAVEMAVTGLRSGEYDLVLAGGVQVTTPIPILTLFSQLKALSLGEQIRPFDEDADGTILSEGLGIVVLKRLADAVSDGDRIYAVIRGVGTASDGRGLSVLAPRVEGEALALRRAFEQAGVSPRSVELIEAHGTATLVGDAAEIESLTRVFGARDGWRPWCAVGTVKSMIGHTMPAAGVAGLIKAALALHHKVLPPTLNVTQPSSRLGLEQTPFYINTETRPWLHAYADAEGEQLRRAGVNAFGFGGINAHVLLEEHPVDDETAVRDHWLHWETEVCLIGGQTRAEIVTAAQQLGAFLAANGDAALKDIAYTLNTEAAQTRQGALCLAIVASSTHDLKDKLERALERLADPATSKIKARNGVYFFEQPLGKHGKLAFCFPGEGAQYVNMLAELALHFPEVRRCFDQIDRAYADHPRGYVASDVIFPPPSFTEAERDGAERRIWQMDVAIEALLTANQALYTLLSLLGIRPDVLVGHSTGEYSAMRAAGMLGPEAEFAARLRELNRLYERVDVGDGVPKATLISVGANREQAADLAAAVGDQVYAAMDNCPHQVVLVCSRDATERVVEQLGARGLMYEELAFDRAYHTPAFAPYAELLRPFLAEWIQAPPRLPLFSCTTVAPYPADLDAIQSIAFEHWIAPVEFRRSIEALYADGVRIFVEVGPRGNLTAFVDDILRGLDYAAVPADVQRSSGITQLHHLIGLLAAHGVPLQLEMLYARRVPRRLDWQHAEAAPAGPSHTGAVKLLTGWPPMEISDETAAQLRLALDARSGRAEQRVPERQAAEREAAQPVAQPASVAPVPAPAQAEQVMAAYLDNAEQFLALQQAVMDAYLGAAASRAGAPATIPGIAAAAASAEPAEAMPVPTDGASEYPFVGQVLSLMPGQRAEVRCELTLDAYPFLRHHSLARDPSPSSAAPAGLAVVPLTMSIEIMAQAAHLLAPGRVLTQIGELRAHRWIALDQQPLALHIVAARKPAPLDEQIVVTIHAAARAGQETPDPPLIEATLWFEHHYAASPSAEAFAAHGSVPSRWKPEQLYAEGMFHGPAMQGVVRMDRCAEQSAEATLEVLPRTGLFKAGGQGLLLTDPVLLDQPGQVLAFWMAEHFERGYVVFPFKLQALRLYGPPLPPGEQVRCLARVTLLTDEQVRADFELVRADGRLWARFSGWEDRRFDLPRSFFSFLLSPRDHLLSSGWKLPAAEAAELGTLRACRVGVDDFPAGFFQANGGIWQRVLVHTLLSERERAVWDGLQMPAQRRLEWLLARLAAKDAVRQYAAARHGLRLGPAEVELLAEADGRPIVAGSWTGSLSDVPSVSLAHADGLAVAVAGDGVGIGVDIESNKQLDRSFEEVAFSPYERELLAGLDGVEGAAWPLRLWCAKEAAAKAVGRGMVGGPRALLVEAVDRQIGLVRVRLGKEFAPEMPWLDDAVLTVATSCDGQVVAALVCHVARPGVGQAVSRA